ncbi:MAG: hypothetical protein U9N83_17385 [Thermodesulfobacteriota bacterium]|nr:hypothetical protein [Thermodesulfobacteriota bacterium]
MKLHIKKFATDYKRLSFIKISFTGVEAKLATQPEPICAHP